MSGAPESRKTHIVRIAFTNKAGDVLSDKTIDVERIDVAKSATESAEGFWQGEQRKLVWADDPSADDYSPDGTPARLTEIVKVFDPEAEDNPDDPEEWAPVRVIKALRSRGGASGDQNYMDRLLNEDLNRARKVVVRRIAHCDTNIDAAAQAAFDSDPTLTAYVVDGTDYQKDLTTKDDSQHVEHEIIQYLKPRSNQRKQAGDVDRGMQVKLRNQYLIDESDEPKGDVTGAAGINPPYRLDPYQNIVNVNFGFKVYVIIAASHGDFAFPNKDSVKLIEQRSSGDIFSGDGSPVTAVLLECSPTAGDDFARLQTSYSSDLGGAELVWAYVCPKTAEVKDNWFSYVQAGGTGIPDRPFLWRLSGQPLGEPLFVGAPSLMKFKIRYAPHLANPPDGARDKMVQMYPTTGENSWEGNRTAGWAVSLYRTDKKGIGDLFSTPAAWKSDNVLFFAETPANQGLLFGKDPPLISADIPYTP